MKMEANPDWADPNDEQHKFAVLTVANGRRYVPQTFRTFGDAMASVYRRLPNIPETATVTKSEGRLVFEYESSLGHLILTVYPL
jgi:hypothetical protein